MAIRRRISVDEAGRELGVSTATVWRMIRRGELPTVRQNGRRLVLAEGLDRKRTRGPARQEIPPLTRSHPIFQLAGAARGGTGRPGARDKHELLDR